MISVTEGPRADHARVFAHTEWRSVFPHRGSLTFWSPPALKALRREERKKEVHVSAQSKSFTNYVTTQEILRSKISLVPRGFHNFTT